MQTSNESLDDLVQCLIGGIPITFLIDSGSKVNIIKGKDWNTLTQKKAVVWNLEERPTDILTPYASGQALDIKHRFQSTINIPGISEKIVSFYIIDKGEISLLGKETAKQMGLLRLGLSTNCINHVNAFQKIKNVAVKLTIDPKVKPVQQPLRRMPISVEARVEERLKEALEKNIIEKVTEPSA